MDVTANRVRTVSHAGLESSHTLSNCPARGVLGVNFRVISLGLENQL